MSGDYTPKYPLDTPMTFTITYDDYCTIKGVLLDDVRRNPHSTCVRLLVELMGKLSHQASEQLMEHRKRQHWNNRSVGGVAMETKAEPSYVYHYACPVCGQPETARIQDGDLYVVRASPCGTHTIEAPEGMLLPEAVERGLVEIHQWTDETVDRDRTRRKVAAIEPIAG